MNETIIHTAIIRQCESISENWAGRCARHFGEKTRIYLAENVLVVAIFRFFITSQKSVKNTNVSTSTANELDYLMRFCEPGSDEQWS